MNRRTVIFIVCTILSSTGLLVPPLMFLGFVVSIAVDLTLKSPMVTLLVPLVSLPAWYFYFKVCGKWLEYNIVSKQLKFKGMVFGTLAVLASAGTGLVFCFPSIILMIYIYLTASESIQVLED